MRCRAPIARTGDRILVSGSHTHTFSNPHGYVFQIGCFGFALCVPVGEPSTYWSWFPGYGWQIELCPGCGEHLGWMFRGAGAPGPEFHGLVLARLMETDAS
jgi:hypothetical protein